MRIFKTNNSSESGGSCPPSCVVVIHINYLLTYCTMDNQDQIIRVPEKYKSVKVIKVKAKTCQAVTPTTIVCTLEASGHGEININAPGYGKVTMLCQEGSTLGPK